MKHNEVGRVGEDIACQFLGRKGFEIIERNYRRPWGEIDIIARKKGIIRFVEVKSVSRETLPDISRETNGYRPEEQVHPMKLKRIFRTAELYMSDREGEEEYQVDVIAVFLVPDKRMARCRLLENIL